MILYPSVDIQNGRVVRLRQGNKEQETVYPVSPLQAAKNWQQAGASFVHMVDLNAAFTGEAVNLPIISEICNNISVKLQLGGGIRTMQDIENRLKAGVERVVIGTAAITNPGLLKEAVNAFGSRHIACGIDAKNGRVAIKGWVEVSETIALSLALQAKDAGVMHIVYTDIAKDCMLSGPNFAQTQELIEKTGLQVIASGGVASVSDLEECKRIGCAGAIMGQALYTGRIDLAAALAKFS